MIAGESHYPIAYVLLDCQQAEQHAALLEHTVARIQGSLEECELNFRTYQSDDELVKQCIGIATELGSSSRQHHPHQLIWVTASGRVSLEDDGALAILALLDVMRGSGESACRSIIVPLDSPSDDLHTCSILLDAIVLCVDSIDDLKGCGWKVGVLDMDGAELDVYSGGPHSRLPVGPCCLLGVVADRAAIEPFLDGSMLVMTDQDDVFGRKSVVVAIHKQTFFYLEPDSSNGRYKVFPVQNCFTGCLMRHVSPFSRKKRSSIDAQTLPAATPECTQPTSTIKDTNKSALKKLLLLALRRAGISRSSKEFPSTWKHLYCGCIFSLRKELNRVVVDQSALIAVIQSNMKSFNIR